MRKNSGQSVRLRFTNQGVIYKNLQTLSKPQTDSIVLDSILYKIELYRPILAAALSSEQDILYKLIRAGSVFFTEQDFCSNEALQKIGLNILAAI